VRLSGRGVDTVATLGQCHAIGEILGKMHSVSQQFNHRRISERGPDWRQNTAKHVMPLLEPEPAAFLEKELDFQQNYSELNLESGVTHSDLFRDNALFQGDKLSGIIDFYYASDEYLLYDLAVAVNDWCVDDSGLIEQKRYDALIESYRQERDISSEESHHWNLVLRAAALRFWLSRLQDKLFPREGELTQIKDPDAFLKLLQQHNNTVFGLF
jgi:homoserine kinase type II